MAMSFSGISSGLPTDQLIQSILSNEALPMNRLQSRQAANTMKKTALQSVRTALTNLATSISSLSSAKLDGRKVTSSDASFVTATAAGAKAGSYDITVNQLATKGRLEMNDTLGANDLVGKAGDVYTITNKDGKEISIALDGDTTLAQLSQKINNTKIVGEDGKEVASGVTSSVVQTKPGEYKLVLSATDTGVGNISISGTPGDVNDQAHLLNNSSFTATAGRNAEFTIDGVAMERSTNTISDAVDGVSLTLNKADAGKTVTLNVAMDSESVVKAFQDVIDKFNVAYNVYKNNSGTNGALANDSTIRSMFTQVKSALSVSVSGEDGALSASSATLGMSTNKDGTLSLDAKKLQEALEKDPGLVGKVFDKMSKVSDDPSYTSAKSLIDGLTTYGGGTITRLIDGIDASNTNLSKQIENMQSKLDRRKEVLTAQFARLESVIGQMQAAGQSLSGLY